MVPTTQETLNDIRKSMQRIEKITPLVEDTFREYRDLGRSLNNSVPALRQTNDDVDKLVRAAQDAVPQVPCDADQITRDADDAAAASLRHPEGRRTHRPDRAQNQEKITQAISNLNDVLSRTSSLLSEENVANVTTIIRNTQTASQSFPRIARNTDETMKEAREALQCFNATLVRTDDLIQNLQKITKPLADRGDPIARNLDESLAKLNRTLTDVSAPTQAVGQSDGTLNKLLTDPSLYNHLDDAACQAAKAAPEALNLILKDLETFADKLARHPELIGIGGAVRPSMGLKYPPLSPPGLIIPPQHP